jgi:hypothetical protein
VNLKLINSYELPELCRAGRPKELGETEIGLDEAKQNNPYEVFRGGEIVPWPGAVKYITASRLGSYMKKRNIYKKNSAVLLARGLYTKLFEHCCNCLPMSYETQSYFQILKRRLKTYTVVRRTAETVLIVYRIHTAIYTGTLC